MGKESTLAQLESPYVGVTFRSVVIGLALIPLICLWLALAEIVWYSGQPTTISLFGHVIFIIFWLVVANLALQRWRPKWAGANPRCCCRSWSGRPSSKLPFPPHNDSRASRTP